MYAQTEAEKIYVQYSSKGWKSLHLHLNRFNHQNRHFFKHMYLHDASQTYMEIEEEWLRNYFEEMLKTSAHKKKLSTEERLAIHYATIGTLSVIRKWIIEEIPLDYQQITQLTINLLPDLLKKRI